MGCGRTVGIVFPFCTSRAGGAITGANWCRSTAWSTPGLIIADRQGRLSFCLLIDNTASVHPPRPQNPRECHFYFAEGCHLYMALTSGDGLFDILEDQAVELIPNAATRSKDHFWSTGWALGVQWGSPTVRRFTR